MSMDALEGKINPLYMVEDLNDPKLNLDEFPEEDWQGAPELFPNEKAQFAEPPPVIIIADEVVIAATPVIADAGSVPKKIIGLLTVLKTLKTLALGAITSTLAVLAPSAMIFGHHIYTSIKTKIIHHGLSKLNSEHLKVLRF